MFLLLCNMYLGMHHSFKNSSLLNQTRDVPHAVIHLTLSCK